MTLRSAAAALCSGAIVVVAWPLAASASAAELVDLADAEARGWFRTEHYGIWCGDVRVGWMRRALVRTKHEDRDAVAREVEMHLDVAGDGNEVATLTRTVFAADAPQLLLAARTEHREQSRRTARAVVRNGMRFDVVTERRGERIDGAVPSATIVLADELSFERLAALAATRTEGPVGTKLVVQAIDLGTLGTGERVFTVTAATGDGPERRFDVGIAVGALRETSRVDATGSVVDGRLGPRFSYKRQSEASAKDTTFRTSLEELSRIRLDAPLQDPATIRNLVLAWDGAQGRPFAATPRQKVRTEGTSLVLELSRDTDGAAVDDRAREEALADEPGLDLSEPIVREAATVLLSGTSNRGVQVARLLEFTSKRLKKEIVLGTPRVSEILGNLRGDCTEHTRTFVALCRAAGIPARAVDGLSWTGDARQAVGWHEWAEVGIGGRWLAVDPTTGANPAPATNIAIDPSPESRTLLWGAKLRLVSVERDP